MSTYWRNDDYTMSIKGKLSVAGIILGVFVVIILLFSSLFAFQKTPADKIALSYGGGMFEGAAFQRIVEPGSGLVFNGFFDRWYEYPVTTREYIISLTAGEGDREEPDAIYANTSDGVQATWELAVYFKNNTSVIREFHENTGLKFDAWTSKGWKLMLEKVFRQQIENSVQAQSARFTADEINNNKDEILLSAQQGIADGLKEAINLSLGDNYFCGPTFDMQNPGVCPDFEVVVKNITLPENIRQSYEAQKYAANAIITRENEAKAAVAEAEGKRAAQEALNGIYTDPNFIAYLNALAQQDCARNTNCVMITPGVGANVNVGK